MTQGPVFFDEMHSPVGLLWLSADEHGLREVRFEQQWSLRTGKGRWEHSPLHLAPVRRQLEEYFAGTRHRFDLTLNLIGTDFQRDVWHALATIPYGITTSYGTLSQEVNRPKASRAVGAANGRNPVSIILPCHRVIGSNGSLTGFGGGLPAKQWLLEHEARYRPAH